MVLETLESSVIGKTAGVGWTVFQKTFDGSVDFYLNCVGCFPTGHLQFWLRLYKIQRLTVRCTEQQAWRWIQANAEDFLLCTPLWLPLCTGQVCSIDHAWQRTSAALWTTRVFFVTPSHALKVGSKRTKIVLTSSSVKPTKPHQNHILFRVVPYSLMIARGHRTNGSSSMRMLKGTK